MSDEEEIPEIHIDHRPHHGQEKTVFEPFDFGGIPEKIKFSIHRMRSLDNNTLQEIRRPPPEYVNIWVKLEYGDWICPVLFDEEGRPYIMAPAKHTTVDAVLRSDKPIEVKVHIRDGYAETLLDLLKEATDFCDHCDHPLETKGGPHRYIDYEAESIADVYGCRFCESQSIRWDKDFFNRHLDDIQLKTR